MPPLLQLERLHDPEAYRHAVDAYLHARLAECSQLFTSIRGLTDSQVQQRQSWLARLHRDGRTCGVALIHSLLPLRSLLLSEIDADGAALIAAALIRDGIVVDDVTGPVDSVHALVAAMRPVPQTRLRARLGNHLLESMPVIPVAPGRIRSATLQDVDLLVKWEEMFMVEVGFPVFPEQLHGTIMQRMDTPGTLCRIWEVNGTPAAMACGRLTPPAARVGPVFTAPAFRGRGCAGALVGELSRELLASGAHALTLFTDLANPTSNGVYKRLGYRQIGELIHYDLLPVVGREAAIDAGVA